MNELIKPHNVGVKNALEIINEVLALYFYFWLKCVNFPKSLRFYKLFL